MTHAMLSQCTSRAAAEPERTRFLAKHAMARHLPRMTPSLQQSRVNTLVVTLPDILAMMFLILATTVVSDFLSG
jgi:hypothetical protein